MQSDPLQQRADPDEVPSDRVDLEDCENLSRELSAVLDVEDPIPQAFNLEVSSPGIDRPLRTVSHYNYFAGSEVKIQLAMPLQVASPASPASPASIERRNFKGILRGVEGDKVVIECDGTTFRLPIDDIEHAKLVPDWDAVMKGKRGVGKPTRRGSPAQKPGHRPSPKHRAKPGQQSEQQPHSASKGSATAEDAERKEQG